VDRVSIQEDLESVGKVSIQEDQELEAKVNTQEDLESVDKVNIREDLESVDRVSIQEDLELEAKDLTLVQGLIITQRFCTQIIHTPRVGTDELHSTSPVEEVSSTNQVVIEEP